MLLIIATQLHKPLLVSISTMSFMAEEPTNIFHILEKAASTNAGVSIYAPGKAPSECHRTTYHDILNKARINAQTIRHIRGMSNDSIVLLHFDRHSDHFDWFWAVAMAGYTPAISTPFVNDPDQRRKHLTHLFKLLRDPIILTTTALESEFLNLEQLRIRTVESMVQTNQEVNEIVSETMCKPVTGSIDGHLNGFFYGGQHSIDDLAILMLTSGSTGNAKAVCLRHNQIIQAVRGKSQHLKLSADDRFLNWIGMDHVANMVEMHLGAMYLCAEQVHVQASDLLIEPLRFLTLVDKHRISCAFSPNFFLASLTRALSGIDTRLKDTHFDLSCLRILLSGGEAGVVSTFVALCDLLDQFGIARCFLRPGFGMTETCAGSIFGMDCPSYDIERGLEYAALGSCIPGMRMRITKDEEFQNLVSHNADVDEIGHLQLSGPVVFKEYFNNLAATQEAFTRDGWFITGDKGYLDTQGKLNLTGRAKETIIINGVNYFPHELETAIEENSVSGIMPSYTVVFPHRPKRSQTEELCVVYLPTFDPNDVKARTETSEAITNVSVMFASCIPRHIIPLTAALLPKSSLGKLSRAKIRAAFESGAYRAMEEENNKAIKAYRESRQELPSGGTEEIISAVFCTMFNLAPNEVWVGTSLFDFGITSIDLIAFKQRLHDKLALGVDIHILTVMQNPTVRGLAEALQTLIKGSQPYDPVVTLQPRGTKTPLWFVHPGNGEILAYLGLAKYITDRPLYALRARGFENGEECFYSIAEAASVYYTHVKRTQPTGPYAILGWSSGSFLAFEVAKLLESSGDRVPLCGNLDTTPNMSIFRLSQMDVLIQSSYLFDLITKQQALEHSASIRQHTYPEAVGYIFNLMSPQRREELGLDLPKLLIWVKVTNALTSTLNSYAPSGNVESMDCFVAAESGLMEQDAWAQQVRHWKNFSRNALDIHRCKGQHHTMLAGDNIISFQKTLKTVLKAKGI